MMEMGLWEDPAGQHIGRMQGSPRELQSCLHLGSEELESCLALAESHSAALSVLRKPRYGFCAPRGAKHASQSDMDKSCLTRSVASDGDTDYFLPLASLTGFWARWVVSPEEEQSME